MFPHRMAAPEKANEIKSKTEYLTVLFDLVITSREKLMPLMCIVISENTVCGYTENSLVEVETTAAYIKKILKINGFAKLSVKIFHDYKAFLSRAEGMNSIAFINKTADSQREKQITQIIIQISL